MTGCNPLERLYEQIKTERGKKRPRGLDAAELVRAFRETAACFLERLTGTGPFYPDGNRKLLPDAAGIVEGGELRRTTDLAALLSARPRFKVDRRPYLDFFYVDREIVPSRASDDSGTASYQGTAPLKLDLLLVNANDATPIVGEVKLRRDKDPEAALVQALLYASMFAPANQRERLAENYPDSFRTGRPKTLDVYVVLFELPEDLQPMLESALRLAAGMAAHGGLHRVIRQLVFLDAYLRDGRLRFRAIAPPFVC